MSSIFFYFFFFFKQKTAYEMRISDWSSDVCSSDLQSIASYTSPGRRALTRTSTTTVAVKAIEDETSPNEVAAMAAAKSDTGTRRRRGANISFRFAKIGRAQV